jgi:hypothetical protein
LTSIDAHHRYPCADYITLLPTQWPEKQRDRQQRLFSYLSAAIMYAIESSYYPYLGLLLLVCGSCVGLVQFLKPTDLKWSGGRKRWAMPPGPPGLPVLGNLRQMMQARRGGALSFNDWVSFKAVEHKQLPWSERPAAILLDTVR